MAKIVIEFKGIPKFILEMGMEQEQQKWKEQLESKPEFKDRVKITVEE